MSGDQQAFHAAMNQGHSSAWDQNWSEAVGFYRMALEQFPNDPMALISNGLALLEMHDYEGALTQYQKAAAVSPNDPVPYEKMARIYESMGRNKEAVKAGMQAAELQLRARDADKSIESWVHVISLDTENLNARTRLAMIYDKMGRKQEASGEYLAAASLMQAAGDAQKAIQAVRYCLQIAPDNVEVQNAMKLLKSNQRLPRPSRPRGSNQSSMRLTNIQQLQSPEEGVAVVRMDPVAEARQRAMEELASMLFDQGDDRGANNGLVSRRGIGSLTRGTGGLSLEQAERTRILLHLGHAIDLQSQGNDKRAAEELQRVLEIGLEKTAVYFDLGMLLVDEKPEKALKYLQNALRRNEYALGSYLLIGRVKENQGELRDAARAYLQAFRLADSETVPAEFGEELRQFYEPILEAQNHENNQDTLLSVCQSVRTQLVRSDWREYLRKARKQMAPPSVDNPPLPLMEMLLQSKSSQVVEALASVRDLSTRGMVRSAMEEAFHALQFAPTYLPLHVQIGDLLIKDGHVQAAVDKFLLVSNLYEVRGELDQSIRMLKRVTRMVPMDLNVRSNLIEMLSSHDRVDEAIQEYLELGEIYYRLAELDMARQSYLSALRLAQQSRTNRKWAVQILTKVADIDMQRLDWRQALRIFEQLRTLQPEERFARMQLIDINFRLSQDAIALAEVDDYIKVLESHHKQKEALQFLTDLMVEYPQQYELGRRMAEMYLRAKQYPQAIAQMDKLADQLLDNGDTWGAIEMLEAIIALNPPNLEQYRQVLSQIKYVK
jgi:tetratricopeptide (TPR) repeat protein